MKNTKELTEIAIFASLGLILEFISGLITGTAWAFGGSISLGVIPVFVVAFRRGLNAGLLTGLIVGVLQIVLGQTTIVHPVQFLLDYVLAYTVVGLAGLFSKDLNSAKIVFGLIVGMTAKFVMHFISGIIYFSEYAGDKHVIIYSFLYNVSYLLPTLILSIVLILSVFKINRDIFEVED